MTTDLVALADAVRDAHALYLFRFYGRSTITDTSAAQATLAVAKKVLRSAWLAAPKAARDEALRNVSTHWVRSGDCPHAAVSSRERPEDLINLPTPEPA